MHNFTSVSLYLIDTVHDVTVLLHSIVNIRHATFHRPSPLQRCCVIGPINLQLRPMIRYAALSLSAQHLTPTLVLNDNLISLFLHIKLRRSQPEIDVHQMMTSDVKNVLVF